MSIHDPFNMLVGAVRRALSEQQFGQSEAWPFSEAPAAQQAGANEPRTYQADAFDEKSVTPEATSYKPR